MAANSIFRNDYCLLHYINKNSSAVHGQKSRLKLKYYQPLSQEDKRNGKCNVVNINNHMDANGTFSNHNEYIVLQVL